MRRAGEAAMFAGFTAFTWFHTILSLVMLVAGIVAAIRFRPQAA
jgi:hypothetical protein